MLKRDRNPIRSTTSDTPSRKPHGRSMIRQGRNIRLASSARLLFAICAALVLGGCPNSPDDSDASGTERINGVQVPPEPDPIQNRATLTGVDQNNNGIRDDIERDAARLFANDRATYEIAMRHARDLQSMLLNPSSQLVEAYIDSIRCIKSDATLKLLSDQTLSIMNTPERRRVYADAMVTAVANDGNC